jgi:YHS domain-containing protein
MQKNVLIILGVVAFVIAFPKASLAAGCGCGKACSGLECHAQCLKGQGPAASAPILAQAAAVPAATQAVNVGNKICPVMGARIDDKYKVTYEYEGKIYNFCCAMCPQEFKKDPAKYIQKVEEELKAGANS